jgi:hypothetical protein
MQNPPKWFMTVAVLAFGWNLLGCMAFIGDVMVTPEAIAMMTPDQQQLYASRTAWSTSATAIAVWGGAAGSLGLMLRKRWAKPLLFASLLGVVVQDFGLFVMTKAASFAGPVAFALQGLVLAVAVALLLLARTGIAKGWIPKQAA